MTRSRWAFAATWTALAALEVWHAWYSSYNHDEIEHLHAAWLMSAGLRPFADFCEQHHPTLWIVLRPLVARVPAPHGLVFAARLVDLVWLGGLLGVFARLVRRHSTSAAAWPTLLLGSSFLLVRNMMVVRPDPLMTLLLWGGLAEWAAYLEAPAGARLRRAVVAGLLLGAAAAVLQKALVVWVLVGAAALVELARRRAPARPLLAGVAVLFAVAAVPLLALYGWEAAIGTFREFWFWNYSFNRFFYRAARVAAHFDLVDTLGEVFAADSVLWLLGLAGLALRLRQVRRAGAVDALLLVVAFGYGAFLVFNRIPLQQYFLMLLPLVALFAADLFAGPRRRIAIAGVCIQMAIFVPCMLFYSHVDEQQRVQEFVLSHTRPEETVFLPPAHNPIFRRDSAFFWYNGALLADTYTEYCRTAACQPSATRLDDARWRAQPPSYVYVSARTPTYAPYHWAERAAGFVPSALPNLLERDHGRPREENR